MDLVKLDKQIPIKSIPEPELNAIILKELTIWVAGLLSLKDEASADRLEIALPAIKEHCWSMGFKEIKKMFEMYADGKLSVKPLPNYFDRIMLGKISASYKEQKPRPTLKGVKGEIPMTKEEIFDNDKKSVDNIKKQYLDTGVFPKGAVSAYTWLDEQGLIQKGLNLNDEQWKALKIDTRDRMKTIILELYKKKTAVSRDEKIEIKNTIKAIESNKNGEVIVASKLEILKQLFGIYIPNGTDTLVDFC